MTSPAERLEPLVHIGYHKTGTTWLQRRIFADRTLGYTRVWPPDVIEDALVAVNPFAFRPDHVLEAFDPFVKETAQEQTTLVVSHERLSGQPLQGGVDAHEIADRLIATFPAARILIGIRDQRDMLISVYKQITTRGLNRDTFQDFLEHRVIQGRSSPVLDFLEFHHLIAYYQSAFGADRVLVLPYESMKDPVSFVGRIAAFVGAPVPTEVSRERDNTALRSSAIVVLRYLNIATRMLGAERWLTGPRARGKFVNARLKTIQRVGRLAPTARSKRIDARWRAAMDDLLTDRFAATNARTAELTGIDLAAYGYVTG